ncbi:MAG: polyphosphate polymerase domain-containing protein [Clostridia bacterium]|nr:polyphosphate polymerase domain-containing protein [Clostridia bacterium]
MIFRRLEKKYLLTETQKEQFIERITPFVEEDEYGRYTLANLYFDNDSFDSIRRSMEKPPFKEKMRLRAYGTPAPDDPIFWELKKKFDHVGYKRRIVTTCRAMEEYLAEGSPLPDSQTFRELDYERKRQNLRPRIYLAYDRVAYYAKDDHEVRITFDENIRYRWNRLDLTLGDEGCTLYPMEQHLLELKVNEGMPIWLSDILTDLKIYPVSFSKYGKIYEKENMLQCSKVF